MIIPAIIENFFPFFSIKGPIDDPNLLTKNANKKNLKPLVIRQVTKKINKLNFIKPLVIVRSLKGTGVNPAINNVTI